MYPEENTHARGLKTGIFLIWLFHISGLIGILMGYGDWFIPKTPVNLVLSGLIFIWAFPIRKGVSLYLFLGFALAGMVVEWIGVHTGWLFGTYAYGGNLGPKVYGVPLLIGLNWALLGMASGALSTRWLSGRIGRILVGALIMTLLDLAIEPVAPVFDFWRFEGGHAPLSNYISWFAVAALFQWAYQQWLPKDGYQISLHLLAAQITFFAPLALKELL